MFYIYVFPENYYFNLAIFDITIRIVSRNTNFALTKKTTCLLKLTKLTKNISFLD